MFDNYKCIQFFQTQGNNEAVALIKEYGDNIKRLINGDIKPSTRKQIQFLSLVNKYKSDQHDFVQNIFQGLEPDFKVWFICIFRSDITTASSPKKFQSNTWFSTEDWKKMKKWKLG